MNYVNLNNRKLRLYLKLGEMKHRIPRGWPGYGEKEREVNPRDRCELTDLFATLESLLREVLLRGEGGKGLRDRPSEERRDTLCTPVAPRYLRFAPCRNILRTPNAQSFERGVPSVLQLKGLSNGGFNSQPILSYPRAIGTTLCSPSPSEVNYTR